MSEQARETLGNDDVGEQDDNDDVDDDDDVGDNKCIRSLDGEAYCRVQKDNALQKYEM